MALKLSMEVTEANTPKRIKKNVLTTNADSPVTTLKSERIFASRFDWTLEIRTSSVYLLYVDYMRKIVDLYDEIGAAAIVDSDGVLLKHIRDTKKELCVMCRKIH